MLEPNLEDIESVKKELGLHRKAYDGKLFEAVAPLMSALADELHKVVAYYEAHATHRHGATRRPRPPAGRSAGRSAAAVRSVGPGGRGW